MPIYDFKCQKCDQVSEYYAKISETERACEEPGCHGEMKRLITTNVSVAGDIQPYLDPHIGSKPVYIKSKQHRREVMRKEGVYESYGKGWI
jgi:putative FmdB family regulatory protein